MQLRNQKQFVGQKNSQDLSGSFTKLKQARNAYSYKNLSKTEQPEVRKQVHESKYVLEYGLASHVPDQASISDHRNSKLSSHVQEQQRDSLSICVTKNGVSQTLNTSKLGPIAHCNKDFPFKQAKKLPQNNSNNTSTVNSHNNTKTSFKNRCSV